jgi:hypothetical protein
MNAADLYVVCTLSFCFLFLTLHVYSKEQNPPREANPFSASQEISRILWNTKFNYSVHKIPQPVRILLQINPDFLKVHRNIILQSTSASSKWPLSLRLPHQNPVCTSFSPPYLIHDPPNTH